MLLRRIAPHVSNVPKDQSLDLTSIIGISILILTSIVLLIFILVVRCRYLRRRTCSLCGQRVAVTGLERVEGFWQRVWHEGCWDKRMGLGGVEKGGGKGAMSPASPRSPRREKGMDSPRMGGSRVSSPLASPGWKPAHTAPMTPHPLASPNSNTLPSTYVRPGPPPRSHSTPDSVPARSTSSADQAIHHTPQTNSHLQSDPYVRQESVAFPFPPMPKATAPLQPPPRGTSRYVHPGSHPYPRVQSPPILPMPVIPERHHSRSASQQSTGPAPSHAVGRETEMGGSRQPLLAVLPPRESSRVASTGVAF